MNRTLRSVVALAVVASPALAKRAAPRSVAPILRDGIAYRAGHVADESRNAGTLEAVELATQRRLWSVRVYEVRYERHQETDVQDVCVRALQTRWPCIVVVDERERRTCVDARSGAISAAPQEEARVNEKELRRNAERAALGRRESRRPGPRHPLRSERGRW